MNDRFKFRGMTLGGEWVYGNLAIINEKIKACGMIIEVGYYISNKVGMPFAYPVRPETIGQCTGLKDKNGKLIYEGDVVRSESYPFKREEEGTYNYAAEICFDKDSAVFFYWIFRTSSRVAGRSEGNTGQLDEYEWEITGNIHENVK